MEAKARVAQKLKGMVFNLKVELYKVQWRTRLAMSKTICALDSSSLKPGSGATKGVLDYGVLWRPGYATWAGLMGREDTR